MAPKTYQKFVSAERHLPLGPRDGDFVTCLLSARENDLAVPLLLKFFDLGETSDELAVVKAVHRHHLGGELGMLQYISKHFRAMG